MIVFLLLVIIAILLMGSSAFIGLVGAVLGIIVGAIALAMLADLWQSLSAVTQGLIVGIPTGLILATWLYTKRQSLHGLIYGPPPGRPSSVASQISPASYVWTTFADALEGRLSPEAMARVHELIGSGDEQALSRFCNDQVRAVYGAEANAVLRRSMEASPRRR